LDIEFYSHANLTYTYGMQKRNLIPISILLLLAACSGPTSSEMFQVDDEGQKSTLATAGPSITATLTATATLTSTATQTGTPTPTKTATATPMIIAAVADVAICGQKGDDQTAALIADWGVSEILIAGDLSNEDGTLAQYQKCYQPSWGVYQEIVHPVPGNHDYKSNPFENYYLYFGQAAGKPGQGYYSFDAGNWHIIGLNSNCGAIACGPSSDQVAWLKQDLANSHKACSIAFWHVPRWNSGPARNADWLYSFWDVLYEAGVDIVINGHDHHYERTAKVDPKGLPDELNGIREFIVGTGGAGHYYQDVPFEFSEKTVYGQFGVLKLVLGQNDYQWQFVNVDGEVLDEGLDSCH